jgi:hypothetical protein
MTSSPSRNACGHVTIRPLGQPLPRSVQINVGAWDGSRLVGSIRVLTDALLRHAYLKSSSTRHTNAAASVAI